MRIPTSLDDWSLELAREFVRTLNGEPSWLDFKEQLNASGVERSENKNSIRRTACAMANAGGGFIIFGVADAQKYPDPEQRIRGISLNGEGRKQFNKKCRTFPIACRTRCEAATNYRGSRTASRSYAYKFTTSAYALAEGIFPKRSDGGSAGVLGVEEVREQMVGGEERRRRAVLFRLKVFQFHQIADGMFQSNSRLHITYDRFDTAS